MSKRKAPEESEIAACESGSGSGSGPGADTDCGHVEKKAKLGAAPRTDSSVHTTEVCKFKHVHATTDIEVCTEHSHLRELPNGNILIVESRNIYVLNTKTQHVTTLVDIDAVFGKDRDHPIMYITAAACDSEGAVFFSGHYQIYRVAPETAAITLFAGNSDYQGLVDGFGQNARFREISDMVHHAGELYVFDGIGSDYEIRRVNCKTGAVVTLSNPRCSTDDQDGPLKKNHFYRFSKLVFNPFGKLLMNYGRWHVRQIDIEQEMVRTFSLRTEIERHRPCEFLPGGSWAMDSVLGCDTVGNILVKMLDGFCDHYQC